MPPRLYTIKSPTNPFLQVVYFLVGGVLLIGMALMGVVILAVGLGLAVVIGAIVYVRVWWFRRKLARSGGQSGAGPARSQSFETDVLEVEYKIVDERDERDD